MLKRRVLHHLPVAGVQALVGFGALAAYTRLLPPEAFGQYALALSAALLVHTVAFTWAEAAAYRFAREPGRDAAASLWMLAVLAVAGAGCVAAGALAAGTDAGLLVAAIGLGGAFRFVSRIAREADRAHFRVGRYAWREAGFALGGFALGVVCVAWFGLGAAGPFVGAALAGFAGALWDAPGLIAAARGGRCALPIVGRFAGYGAPLALALAVDLALQTWLRWVLARVAGPEATAAYAAALGLVRPLDIVFVACGLALGPVLLARYEAEGPAAAAAAARGAVRLTLALTVPAAVGLALVGGPLAQVLVGPALAAPAGALVPLTALAGLFSGFAVHYFSEPFQLARRTAQRGALIAGPAALAGLLAPAAAASWGAAGVAGCAALAAGLSAALLAGAGRAHLALPLPAGAVVRPLLAAAAMAGAMAALGPGTGIGGLLAAIGLGALAYGACLALLEGAAHRAAAFALWREVRGRLLKSRVVGA